MLLLDAAWGFGSEELAAPQATLMKMIVEGVMEGTLPWSLVFMGVFIALSVEILGIPVLPVAIGLYLPLELTAAIMIGGLVRFAAEKRRKAFGGGILFCSGLIAGEGLAGILLALLAVFGINERIDLSDSFSFGALGTLILLVTVIILILRAAAKEDITNEKTDNSL